MSPTLVLVHGAWHDTWCWEKLIDALPDIETRAVSLPSSGHDPSALGDLRADADALRSVLASVDGPVVVCAHSYGGLPATEVAGETGDVRRLVYLCAFQLDVGESLLGAAGGTGPEWWDVHEAQGHIEVLRPQEVFYGDLDADTAAAAAARLGYQSLRSVTQPLTAAAWRTVPSTYVVAERDAAIPVPVQEAMAHRAQVVRRLDTSHSPFLARPAVLADLLREELAKAEAEG
ncbi:alpha/beta fold hydrolase [Actinomadura sp. HBU206391]|uniref:alpha/beta fold hydrolase n=1 Tax=Actinomadura sp. HBU206391 TaxID=2731692 RepID=UPI001C9C007B|nr:alpha/beta hydrolase [Actinomadura sp. HBU206391]